MQISNLILLTLWLEYLSFLDSDNTSIEDRLHFTGFPDQLQVDVLTSFPCIGESRQGVSGPSVQISQWKKQLLDGIESSSRTADVAES